jgi:acetyl-CoA carboxylase biotin carboxyl carrier protein
LTTDELSELLGLVSDTDITELDLTVGTTRLSLRRPALPSAVAANGSTTLSLDEPPSLAITSPGVGIFHPAVGMGDDIQSGQTIGAIKALGMPTNVDAPRSGTVEAVLVQDGAAVEYGQPLLILRRASNVD